MYHGTMPLSITKPTDINDKIAGVSREKSAQFINEILDNVVSIDINWMGCEVIHIRGFKGNLELRDLIKKMLESDPRNLSVEHRVEELCWKFEKVRKDQYFGEYLRSPVEFFLQMQRNYENNNKNFRKVNYKDS